MIDLANIDQYIAQDRFGDDLGRRAICVKGVLPQPQQGRKWVKDSFPKPLSISVDAEAALREKGYVVLWP
jgi:hypothetical protein